MKKEEEKIDEYINKIKIYDKTYAIKAYITEIHPINCPKCGGSFELKYGNGKCPYCNTYFTTEFKLVET